VSISEALQIRDFKTRTETADGNSVELKVGGWFAHDYVGERAFSGRVRLVRAGGEWCVTGDKDEFRSIQNNAVGIFGLPAGSAYGDGPVYESQSGEWIIADAVPREPGNIGTTESGLRYVEIEEGTGETPQPGQMVRVNFTMWVKATGEEIDSTRDREPFEFTLGHGEVIDGFDEGVATMREGGRRRLTVPPKLGHGRDDDYPGVPSNSTLVFDVELVDVQ
jgi:peptidylprolyl isomerase